MASNLLNIQTIEIYKQLFKKKSFDFIATKEGGEKNAKQELALNLLVDSPVTELMYGGAAGGAKSWTGCVWLTFMSVLYPGTKWFIGRESLKDIRDSTFITFGKVARKYGLKIDVDWKYDGRDNYILFSNGSRIDMLDLSFKPSDPMYERLGSKEYTGGFLEECGQIHFNAFDVLKTRIGRHLNDKYGIKAKLFLTCNPKKNWIYSYFVKAKEEKRLPQNREFIKSLVTDNPHRESDYLERLLSITDPVQRARLLDGSFEYDDDPAALIDYDSILGIFKEKAVKTGTRYITCDVARYGRDSSVVMVWDGFKVVYLKQYAKNSITELANVIKGLREKYNVPQKNVVVDEDGVGGGLVDILKCKGFVNNSSPIYHRNQEAEKIKENYANLKSQCYFKLAERIKASGIYISAPLSLDEKDAIIEELEQVKQRDIDTEGKRAVVSKETVRDNIDRSPDYSDCLMMREYFELAQDIKVNIRRNFK